MIKKVHDAQALLGDVAYDAVRKAILTNEFKPGDRISEYKVAAWLGISRTPAREGLRRLESEGLLSAHPRRGLVVASVDDDAFEQLYAVRELLEGAAAAAAAINASESDISMLQHMVEAEADMVNDPELMHEHNLEFHGLIYRAARNKFLLKFLESTADTLSAYRHLSTLLLPERRHQVIAEHRELCEAIAQRDSALAQAVAVRHVQNALRMRIKVRHSNLLGQMRQRSGSSSASQSTEPA